MSIHFQDSMFSFTVIQLFLRSSFLIVGLLFIWIRKLITLEKNKWTLIIRKKQAGTYRGNGPLFTAFLHPLNLWNHTLNTGKNYNKQAADTDPIHSRARPWCAGTSHHITDGSTLGSDSDERSMDPSIQSLAQGKHTAQLSQQTRRKQGMLADSPKSRIFPVSWGII